MIDFRVDQASLDKLTKTLNSSFLKNIEIANREIATDWAALLINQQRRFHRSLRWPPLSKTYLDRKRKEYRRTDVRYLVTLKRTGQMLAGYLEGIQSNVRFSDGSLGVMMPFPPGDVGIRAQAHQGVIRQPRGMPIRPFDLDEFEKVAVARIDQAIVKSLDG